LTFPDIAAQWYLQTPAPEKKVRSLTVAGTVWLLRRTPISRLTALFEQKGEHYQPLHNITDH
jgi:hypothetical protein